MAAIVLYKAPTEAEVVDAIGKIREWFSANPKRKVCNADLWYGIRKIHRKTIEADIRRGLKK